jgi:hypothetical protein
MTRRSPRKRVDAFFWQGRLRAARADQEAFARWADDLLSA